MKYLAAIILLLVPFFVVSQQSVEWIIPLEEQEYDAITSGFDHGIATIEKDGKSGAINDNNNIVVDPIHNYIFIDNNGVIKIYSNSKYIYYNNTGIVSHQYKSKRDKIGSDENKSLISIYYGELNYRSSTDDYTIIKDSSNLWGALNKKSYASELPFAFDSLAVVNKKANILKYLDKGKWGIINLDKKNQTSPIYKSISDFDDFFIKVVTVENKTLLLNHELKEVLDFKDNLYSKYIATCKDIFILASNRNVPDEYGVISSNTGAEYLYNKSEDYRRGFGLSDLIFDANSLVLLDRSGRLIDKAKLDSTSAKKYNQYENTCLFDYYYVSKDSIKYVYNNANKLLFETQYQKISIAKKTQYSDSFIQVFKKEGTGYVSSILSSKGDTLLPFDTYDEFISNEKRGIIFFKKKSEWGFCNTNSKGFYPAQYLSIDFFSNDDNRFTNEMLVVQKNGRYGLLDFHNETILEVNHASIRFVHDRIKAVSEDGVFQVIHPKTLKAIDGVKKLAPPTSTSNFARYDGSALFDEYKVIPFRKNNLLGFKNIKGKTVLPAKYSEMKYFTKKKLIAVKEGELWGLLDENLNFVINPTFHSIDLHYRNNTISQNCFFVSLGDAIGAFQIVN